MKLKLGVPLRLSTTSAIAGLLLLFPQTLAAQAPTEVVLIGTHHAITSMPTEYTPGHLRALLDKIKPAAVGVEAASNESDPYKEAPAEIALVVKPWAEAHSCAIIPIGWKPEKYNEQTDAFLKLLQAGSKQAEYQQVEQQFQQRRGALPPSCEGLNSDGHQQMWRDYHRGIDELSKVESPWRKWNTKIFEQIKQACQQHPGERLAVVIGAAHVYCLQDELAKEPSIRVLRVDQYLPITPAEVAATTKPADWLAALAPLNLDALPPPELMRLEQILDKIKDVAELKNDYHLYRGKFMLHVRQPALALKEFEQLGTLARDVKCQFDGQSSLFETGLVYTAIALLQSGDAATARTRLQNVLADKQLGETTRKWAEQVLSQIPKN